MLVLVGVFLITIFDNVNMLHETVNDLIGGLADIADRLRIQIK